MQLTKTAVLLLFALALPLSASSLLTVSVLPNPVPQSESNPCIICGTTQAHNPPTFGYNNFDTTGHTESLTLFSTNLFASLGDNVQDALANNYMVSQVLGLLANHLTFGIAIDVSSAEGGNPPTIMQLQSFQMIDLTTATILASTAGPVALPDINPGNGKGDYLISGFSFAGINVGDRIVFRAQFSGATDGPDSFYIVGQQDVPEVPEIATMLLMGSGLVVLSRRYRRQLTAV